MDSMHPYAAMRVGMARSSFILNAPAPKKRTNNGLSPCCSPAPSTSHNPSHKQNHTSTVTQALSHKQDHTSKITHKKSTTLLVLRTMVDFNFNFVCHSFQQHGQQINVDPAHQQRFVVPQQCPDQTQRGLPRLQPCQCTVFLLFLLFFVFFVLFVSPPAAGVGHGHDAFQPCLRSENNEK